jgi:chromate transport protein ChrA
MIYPFWMTARMRRHHYRVCVRPTRQGEFLIHPFAHKRGGVGYVATKSIKDQWEAPFMHPTYIALIVGILISCLLLIVIGTVTLPILILMIAGWRLKLKMDENKRFQALRPQMRIAPMTLSKKRYDIEYASQYTEKELKNSIKKNLCLLLGFGGLLVVFALQAFWLLWTATFLIFLGCCLYLMRLFTLKKRKLTSFRYSLVAGDPIFIPIPEDTIPISEPEKSIAS